jgi:hypothetical protein
VEDQKYTNPFEDVHRKAKAFKDRAREANKNDAELRKSKLVQEAKEILDEEPSSSGLPEDRLKGDTLHSHRVVQ